MEMENKKLRDVAEIARQIMVGEELKGGQKKIDKNHNGKIYGQDFAILRGQKAEVKKEEVELQEDNLDTIAKKHGMELKKTTYGAGMKHPKHGEVSINRYGEWNHKGKTGDSTGNFASLDKHLSSLKEEVEELEEADIEKTATGVKVYGSSYGNSQRARREQIKRPVDDAKGPKMKELKAIESEKKKKMSEMVATFKEQGLKGLFEALKKEEVIVEEPTSAEFDAQLADAKQRAAGTKKQPEISKPAVQAVQNEETHTTVEFIDYNDVNGVQISEIDLEERHMTEPETKKKEEIVKSMKKGIAGFKDRYGDRAKEVMYATATKQAMKD